MTTEEEPPPGAGLTSTRVADFASGTGSFSISRPAEDIIGVAVLDRAGAPVPVESFEAVDREDYPGVALVTITAAVDDGPQSVQATIADH